MPGMVGTGGVTGLGARLMMRLQLGRGQAMRCDELLQINKQLQGQRTYFLPGGAFLIGCNGMGNKYCVLNIKGKISASLTVASLQ